MSWSLATQQLVSHHKQLLACAPTSCCETTPAPPSLPPPTLLVIKWFAYVRHLQIDRPLRVQDVVEQVAVVVVTGKLGLQGRLELERRRGGLQLGVDVLVAADGRHAVELVHAVVLALALLRRGGVALGNEVKLIVHLELAREEE